MDLPPPVQEPAEQQQSPHELCRVPSVVTAFLLTVMGSHRSGKRVYYRLNGAGESLLGIFDELA
jgi:hypothetical protein